MFARRVFSTCVFAAALMAAASAANAAGLSGIISDASGAPVPSARIVVRDLATGKEITVVTGTDGKYQIDTKTSGTFLLVVTRDGFAEAARTIVVNSPDQTITVPVRLEVGGVSAQVTVTPSRSAREAKQIPLNVDSISGQQIAETNPLSTGQSITAAANVTPVGDGPFGVRPRLRGLDSTRLLVLVDGERLNTARLATGRAGAETGLVAADNIERVEIVNGAGTLMYGSDAMSGTINVTTNQPKFSASARGVYGFNGFYSSNENGMRGSVVLGTEGPKFSVRIQAGAEQFDNYTAGKLGVEDTRPYYAAGTLKRADTIDTNFGFKFKAFPDPFNAPYTRTDATVLNSSAKANFVNAAGIARIDDRQTVTFRYQQRRAKDIGFPDFADPYFFNAQTLPKSDLDRYSARYELQAPASWIRNVSVTARYQQTERLLRNTLPVQFPAPTAVTFFPITVFRLDILSETTQKVTTPGLDVQAVFVPAKNHLLTAGVSSYRDNSRDSRMTSTQMSMVGMVALGSRGPAATVFPTPIALGAPTIAHPVRVPNAALTDVGVFAQDEWRIAPKVSLTAGLRGDYYVVSNDATAGYDVASIVAGAKPAVSTENFPDANGASYSRRSLTGDIGLIANTGGTFSPFVRFGRSYRHPNLEELFFAGPATAGSLVPNIKVKPETGNNFDAGVKISAGRLTGGLYGFVNQYQNFIAQDQVVASTSSGQIAQTRNIGDVRIGGLEANASMPFVTSYGVFTVTGSGAYLRGTVLSGTNAITNQSLAGTPADDITPFKFVGSARFTDIRNRFWVEYGVRTQTKVNRVADTLLQSPFLIAQDLLSLDGFTIQRLGAGYTLTQGPRRARLTFAVENLGNKYFREQFQFAPARGRSMTLGMSVGVF
ncbi:MAG: TonB-dependent receptor [Acidobacteria bacterium]|nr:MAG: TonB-dependent receptor [Acidobacteriota bacterium]